MTTTNCIGRACIFAHPDGEADDESHGTVIEQQGAKLVIAYADHTVTLSSKRVILADAAGRFAPRASRRWTCPGDKPKRIYE